MLQVVPHVSHTLHGLWWMVGNWLCLGLGALVGLLVIRRDWRDFEIADNEILVLLLLGCVWNAVYGQGIVMALAGGVVCLIPNAIGWMMSRGREVPFAAEGDLMLGAAVGAWVGLPGLPATLVLSAVFGIGVVLCRIPKVRATRARLASVQDAPQEFTPPSTLTSHALGAVQPEKYEPTAYNAIPMAPPVVLAAGCIVAGYLCGWPVLVWDLATAIARYV